jgi:hypothetical protein
LDETRTTALISAEAAISKARTDRVVSVVVKVALLLTVIALVVLRVDGPLVILLVAAIWVVAGMKGAQGTRAAVEWPTLIATGRYDEAEKQIEQALGSFATFSSVKLLGLHHLALLRHAQRRFGDSAQLCRAVLGQRLTRFASMRKQSRLVLADSLLELGDLAGAADAINALFDQRLTLPEALNLLRIQLDYLARTGHWDQVLSNVQKKVQMAELMPATAGTRTEAILALAARKTGRRDWEEFLRRRVELTADVNELLAWRPGLSELWRDAPGRS